MGLDAGFTEITGIQVLRAASVQFQYTVLSGENESSLSTCMNYASTNTSNMKQDISVSMGWTKGSEFTFS
jgi:hypothetical protein